MSSSPRPISSAEPSARGWWWAAALVLAAAPLVVVLNAVVRFAVDVPYWDQWELVPLLERQAAGQLGWAELWAWHNEHRIFLPRLVMLGLAALSGWDTRWEIAVIIGFRLAAIGAAWAVHARAVAAGPLRLLAFAPTVWLMLTLRQEENLLWGWQLSVTLCALAVGTAAALLGAPVVGAPRLAAAALCGVVASWSFGSGVLLWPAGAAALAWRWHCDGAASRWGWRLLAWCALALVIGGVTVAGFVPGPFQRPLGEVLREPLLPLRLFVTALGGAFSTGEGPGLAAVAGVVVLALGVGLLVRAWRRANAFGASALLLFAFALGSAALVAVGRTWAGPNAGLASRYTTLTLLAVVGLLPLALGEARGWGRWATVGPLVLLVAVGSAVALATEFSLGAKLRRERAAAAEVLRTFHDRSDQELTCLYPVAAVARERAGVLERLGLSVFRGRAKP